MYGKIIFNESERERERERERVLERASKNIFEHGAESFSYVKCREFLD
jgi:hypothetical protein